jgi:hypothetical protein
MPPGHSTGFCNHSVRRFAHWVRVIKIIGSVLIKAFQCARQSLHLSCCPDPLSLALRRPRVADGFGGRLTKNYGPMIRCSSIAAPMTRAESLAASANDGSMLSGSFWNRSKRRKRKELQGLPDIQRLARRILTAAHQSEVGWNVDVWNPLPSIFGNWSIRPVGVGAPRCRSRRPTADRFRKQTGGIERSRRYDSGFQPMGQCDAIPAQYESELMTSPPFLLARA